MKTKIIFTVSLLAFYILNAWSQPCRCSNGGYTTSIYQNQILASNVQYTQNTSLNYDGTSEQESMDI